MEILVGINLWLRISPDPYFDCQCVAVDSAEQMMQMQGMQQQPGMDFNKVLGGERNEVEIASHENFIGLSERRLLATTSSTNK